MDVMCMDVMCMLFTPGYALLGNVRFCNMLHRIKVCFRFCPVFLTCFFNVIFWCCLVELL